MNLLSGTYIFYADVYFIQNFIIKVAVIYLSLYCNKLHFVVSTLYGVGRIALVAGIGTIIEIAGLLLGNSYNLFLVLVHILEIPLMIWFLLRKEKKNIWKIIVSGYFFVMLINAVLEILWNWFGKIGNYVFFLCISCGSVYIGIRIFQNYNKMQKGIFPVEILQEGKSFFIYGLYDSGNRLVDPYTQKGVHIISEKIVMQMSLHHQKEVYIPYHALGNEQGLIRVYYLEYIRIQKEQNLIEYEKVPVGVAEESLFQNKRYQMILNEEVL